MAGGIGPDGMLVDSKGNVYTAHYMAGEVVVHDRFGFQIGVIKLPADAGMGSTWDRPTSSSATATSTSPRR
jgi:sugar lactone lactonase YvrE